MTTFSTEVEAEQKRVIGVLIDLCQWYVAVSSSCLLNCPPVVQSIDSVCEVLTLADIAPCTTMSNMNYQLPPLLRVVPPPPGLGGTINASVTEALSNNAIQFMSQLVSPVRWQRAGRGCAPACSVLLPFQSHGPWSKPTVGAINDMLMGTTMCGRVQRESGQTPLFYPLEPAGSGMFLADVLSERGYCVRDSQIMEKVAPANSMMSPTALPCNHGFGNSYPTTPIPPTIAQVTPQVSFNPNVFPLNTVEQCSVSCVERGPWKFSIQLKSQTPAMNTLRSLLNSDARSRLYATHHLQVMLLKVLIFSYGNLI